MSSLPITVACWDYDRTRALIDGRVKIAGCEARYVTLPPEESFRRAWTTQEFDVSELGLCTYLAMLSRATCPYVAVPAFVSRMFRHSAIYIRNDRGIEGPEDLRGKRIGVPFYEMAAAVWVRGFLNDDYGVAADDIFWHQGGLDSPGRPRRTPLNLSAGFPLTDIPERATLSGMLRRGELDGIVAPGAPSCFEEGCPKIRRLFPDYREIEIAYFRRTGIFPIMHVIGIRETLAEAHPGLAESVFTAFTKAKQLADAELRELVAPKVGLPWIAAELATIQTIMGDDFWPYGVEGSRIALQAAARYAFDQGLTTCLIPVEEMFAGTGVAPSS